MSQTEIKNPNDPMEPIPSVLKVSKKLLSGRHVNDLGLPQQQEDVQPDAAVQGEQTSVDLDVSTSAGTSVSQTKKLQFMSSEVQFLKQQRVHLKQRQRELESILSAYEAVMKISRLVQVLLSVCVFGISCAKKGE